MLCANCGFPNDELASVCGGCGAGLPGGQSSSGRVDRIINDTGGLSHPTQRAETPPAQWTNPPYTIPPQPVFVTSAPVFRCPFCQSPYPPFVVQKVSGAGWVVFVLLILLCVPLCWIGLLIKEDHRVCSSCRMVLG